MQIASRSHFETVTTEGAILPADLLQRIAGGEDLDGLRPQDYHLAPKERINEAINRAWNRCLGAWHAFDELREALPEQETGTSETRERWLLILFQELGYGRLRFQGSLEAAGEGYPISHDWGAAPIHLVTFRQDLDRRGETIGSRHASPHSLVQEYLNRNAQALWGFVSNGLRLRILRDNASLTRSAYVELDLEAMMTGERYSDFSLLWLLCHQSRIEAEPQTDCWLERWSQEAAEQGVRALDVLRDGVQEAIATLGSGFLAHPANSTLREDLESGRLDKQDYYRQLLRLVYRLIFLFVAEDRDLLLHPEATDEARRGYQEHYSLSRLRRLAAGLRGGKHADLYQGLRQVFTLLREGYAPLGLPGLGGLLFGPRGTPDLDAAELPNAALLDAIRALAFVIEGRVRRPVDYRNLGAEEMGSVYESLLELQPELDLGTAAFKLRTVGGSERKTTGSYYTPTALIEAVLKESLEPLVAERLSHAGRSQEEREDALLRIRIVDPACGSGHFLIAAARHLARHVARVRTGDEEPAPRAQRQAMRDVVRRCIYGVDINEMAVELCKVALWLETLDPGLPLGFIDANLRHGNSLIGANPAMIAEGLPDEALNPLEGDLRTLCHALKRRNKEERSGQLGLFTQAAPDYSALERLGKALREMEAARESTLADVSAKEARYSESTQVEALAHTKLLADAHCAVFFWEKTKEGIPTPTFNDLSALRSDAGTLNPEQRQEVERLARHYGFFHWHVEFPQVFQPSNGDGAKTNEHMGWQGGFDLVLGNPPWDTMSPDTKEFFSQFEPEIRHVARDGQREIMDELLEDPVIAEAWHRYRRDLYGTVSFIKHSGAYRLFAPGNLGKGDFNTYRFFVELALETVAPGGYASQIVPENLYNGANAMAIRQALFERFELRCLFGFENARETWFPGIDSRTKFTLYAAHRSGRTESIQTAFNIRDRQMLARVAQGDTLRLPIGLIKEFSPDALALMEFGSQLDIDICAKMYERWPKFGDSDAGPPYRHYMAEVHMGNDRELFTEDPRGLPVYEGRMVGQYDHCAKGYRSGRGRSAVWEELPFGDPDKSIQPQWRILPEDIPEKARDRVAQFRIGFCDVASPTNERSLVATILPRNCISGDKVPTITFSEPHSQHLTTWLAVANSFAMDFLVRKKISLKMSYTVLDSLPFPRLDKDDALGKTLSELVARLLHSSPDLTSFCERITAADSEKPEKERQHVTVARSRIEIMAKIDGIVARDIYGLSRREIEHVLSTFPIVRRRQIDAYGEYLSERLIIETFDRI